MSQIDDILFELERRVILFKSTTTLPDSSPLGYNGDPNSAVDGNTAGETLIYNCPVGSRYQQDDGTQWYKETLPNTWMLFGSGEGIVEATYSELQTLVTNSELVVGQKYLITDHQRTYIQPVTGLTKTGTIEPIIVTALTTSEFEPIAYSTLYPQDILYYEFSGDTKDVFGSADKGVIYRRIDTLLNNDIGLDFRQILSYRDGTVGGLVEDDYPLFITYSSGNVYNNTFVDSYNNVFIGGCQGNKINSDFRTCTLGNNFLENQIGSYFIGNKIGSNFYGNTIVVDFTGNTIGNNFVFSEIRGDFTNSTVGINFYFNRINAAFNSCNVGDYFDSNVSGSRVEFCIFPNNFKSSNICNSLSSIDFTGNTTVTLNTQKEIIKLQDDSVIIKYNDNYGNTIIENI